MRKQPRQQKKTGLFRRMAISVFLTLTTLLVGVATLAKFCLQDIPVVIARQVTDVQTALDVRDFVHRTADKVLHAEQPVTVSISAKELNSAFGLAARAVPGLSGRINIESSGLLGATTYIMPPTPFGRFLNVTFYVHPSAHGLAIQHLQFGDIKLGGRFIYPLMRTALNLLLGQQQGSLFFDSIKQISFESGLAHVWIEPPANLHTRIAAIKDRFRLIRDKTALYGDPQRVSHYYRVLMIWTQRHGDSEAVSLSHYLIPLFSEARRQSVDMNPRIENQAAILALAMYLGHGRFESFIGTVRDAEMQAFKTPDNVVLAGRIDLRLHFIFSAAFKILSDQGISMALGEFKELMDSGRGGSGFSFPDLAADRSGVFFAELASTNEAGARLLQDRIAAGITEADMFPPIHDLPEGLSQLEFASQYKSVSSGNYQTMVQNIDARIKDLALYQN